MSKIKKVSFRKAVEADVSFLVELRESTMEKHLLDAGIATSKQYHLSRVQEHFDDSQIIYCDGKIAGLLKLGTKAESLHVRQLQILPKYQGYGLGSRVLEQVKIKAAKKQLPVTLSVLLKNPAKFLYLRHGFTVVGQSKLEYLMECPLNECQTLLNHKK